MFKDWQLNPGASEETIHDAGKVLAKALPSDYVQFIKDHDGGEGFVGDNYLILWKIEELHTFNREYEVEQYAPSILLFGSNGGGEAYGFDTRSADWSVVRVPFIGMELRYARPVADNFKNLLSALATK